MSPPRRALLALAVLTACSRDEKTSAPPAPSADSGGHVSVASASAPAVTGDASPSSVDPHPYMGSRAIDGGPGAEHASSTPRWAFDCRDTSVPKSGKSIGHTSVVFKVELSNGKKAAWKPNAKKVRGRYRGEIAAYRLAEALGLVNVPPACFRAFETSTATSAVAANADAAKLFADEVVIEGGKVHGVLIPWIDGLSFWPLEKEPLRSEARRWLTAGSEIPEPKLELAAQTSTLIAFDFITGNWDRYSGENVGIDRSGTLVLFIDNDGSFMETAPKERLARNKALVDATDRFSRRVVGRLRELDEERLAAAFGEEVAGKPLLSKKMVSTVASRVKDLVAVVDAKIAKRGEAETLYFP